MMKLAYHVVDAFTDTVFHGNPACVLVLDAFLPDALMQSIAFENNLSETAFVVADGADWRLRWFTPTVEVDLCGHATLASSWVLAELGHPAPYCFHTRSGLLRVTRDGRQFVLDFPAWLSRPAAAPPGLAAALGATPREVHVARDWICVFDTPEQVIALRPDHSLIAGLPGERVIVTAAGGRAADITSRYFAAKVGIPEDPVTGGAHVQLVPFWSPRLGKNTLVCHQASPRGGMLWCAMAGERVHMAGTAILYASGEIFLPE